MDGSKKADAVVIFLRIENENGVELRFLGAKSRITPGKIEDSEDENDKEKQSFPKKFEDSEHKNNKKKHKSAKKNEKITIPRIEVLAAVIGSRFSKEIVDGLGLSEVPIYYWSDSTTVLAWIKRDLQWRTFVCNRVKEIRELTDAESWKYVPGEINPADLPSRGCKPIQLLESLWWEGPDWLIRDSQFWPQQNFEVNEEKVEEELKKFPKLSVASANITNNIKLSEKFESYDKLIHFFAILRRFRDYLTHKETYTEKTLCYTEFKEDEIIFLRHLQSEMFLPQNDPRLSTIEIILIDGLMRVKTNLLNALIAFPFYGQ